MSKWFGTVGRGVTWASAALGVAVLALWARSYFVADAIDRYGGGRIARVASDWGSLSLAAWPVSDAANRVVYDHSKPGPQGKGPPPAGDSDRHAWGFRRESGSVPAFWPVARSTDPTYWRLTVPHWSAALLLAVAPALAFVRHLRRRPAHGPRCRVCGYDLRATPQRCPECGTIAA